MLHQPRCSVRSVRICLCRLGSSMPVIIKIAFLKTQMPSRPKPAQPRRENQFTYGSIGGLGPVPSVQSLFRHLPDPGFGFDSDC